MTAVASGAPGIRRGGGRAARSGGKLCPLGGPNRGLLAAAPSPTLPGAGPSRGPGRATVRTGRSDIDIAPGVRIESPAELGATGAAIDSKATAWKGPNLEVVADEGPLADQLTSYEGRPGARTSEETIGGRSARVVAFPLEDGESFAAAHFPAEEGRDALTISVTGRAEHGGDTPLRILRTVTFG